MRVFVVYTCRVPKGKGLKDFMKHENSGKWIGKKTIVMMSAAIIAAGTLGGIAIADLSGVGIKLPQPTYAGSYALTSDETAALAKYKSSGASSLSAAEMVLTGIAQFKEHNTGVLVTEGSASGVTSAVTVVQTVKSSFVHSYNEYFLEANSYGYKVYFFVDRGKKVGHRGYIYDVSSDYRYSVGGTANSGAETCSWSWSGASGMTSSSYSNTYGKDVNDPFIYDINDSTSSGSITHNADGTYTVVLTVDSNGWTEYIKQIEAYGGETFGAYKSCQLTFTLTSSLELRKMHTNEVYTIAAFLTATVTNTLDTYYQTDGSYTIPRNPSSTNAHNENCISAGENFPFSTYWSQLSA
jgi:hypothetical protein